MSEHTPGPWEVHDRLIMTRHGEEIARTFEPDIAEEERHNARLIAAAPELLEAAEMAEGWILGKCGDDVARARDISAWLGLKAAIAKATGKDTD